MDEVMVGGNTETEDAILALARLEQFGVAEGPLALERLSHVVYSNGAKLPTAFIPQAGKENKKKETAWLELSFPPITLAHIFRGFERLKIVKRPTFFKCFVFRCFNEKPGLWLDMINVPVRPIVIP
jgi:hypothetical protein